MMWLMNLNWAGGSDIVGYDFSVDREFLTFYVNKVPEVKRVYLEPPSKKAVTMDWSAWLDGSTISEVSWTASSNALTISNTTNSNTQATAYISTATLNAEYELYCKITTADAVPRIEQRTIQVICTRLT